MCALVIPGQPISVDIEGTKFKIKALTWGEKLPLAESFAALPKRGPKAVLEMLKLIVPQIVGIDGFDDVESVLAVQPESVILKVVRTIFASGSLTDAEVKNFQPSSDGQQQDGQQTAAAATHIGSASGEDELQ